MTDEDPARSASPLTGLSHVQLLVSDVRASAEWYDAALGLEPYTEDLDNGYVALRHRGARIVVVLTTKPEAERPGERDLRSVGDASDTAHGPLDHLAFAVSDEGALRAWADHLTDIGVQHAGVLLEDGNPSLQLRDPDGIAIELVARRSMTGR